MTLAPALLAEVHRGPFAESLHFGHVVVHDGVDVVQAWGDPEAVVLPRSSAKMIQALPLLTSGAAEAQGLSDRHLALACASHQGAPLHVDLARRWLADLSLSEAALRCGPQPSRDKDLRFAMIREGVLPCQVHNNCSGKHTGFLTLARHLGAGPEYLEIDHPVQAACRAAFEEITAMESPGYGIDGCSAPNFATTMAGMARAMAWFANAPRRPGTSASAATRLIGAMVTNPMLVAGQGRACTLLMQAATEPVALKTGAEGYFVAILPNRGLGVALKALDGATRAAECAIAAVLVRLGVLEPDHPDVARFLRGAITNWRGTVTGHMAPAPGLMA